MSFIYTLKGTARRTTRLVAVQILYQVCQSRITAAAALAQFEEQYVEFCSASSKGETGTEEKRKHRAPRVEVPFLRQLVLGVTTERETIRAVLERHVRDGWTVERLPIVLLCILELAIYELEHATAPIPIVINEAIELTKEFFEGEEPSFVNGLLDRVQKELHQMKVSAKASSSAQEESCQKE